MLRFTYAILKLSKDEILKQDTKKGLITKLREVCKTMSQEEVARTAFSLQLKTTGIGSNLKFTNNSEEALQSKLKQESKCKMTNSKNKALKSAMESKDTEVAIKLP